MPAKIATQFAQVYIHYFSNRSRATTKLFISEPTKQSESRLGKLFGIIEINTPSKENSKIINQLISGMEAAYYSFDINDTETSVEKVFENTLKVVNDDFLRMIAANESYLIGNLNEYTIREKINFVIGVLHEDKIHLTSLNKVGALLVHKTNQGFKTFSIIERQTEEEKSKELKLFDNIVSGEVSAEDYLFFCNNDLLNFISKERIQKTITSLPPSKAADYFKNSLLQNDGFNFASIIVKLTPVISEEDLTLPESLTSVNDMNLQESETSKLLSPSLLPSLKKGLSSLFSKRKKEESIEVETTHTVSKAEIDEETGAVAQSETTTHFSTDDYRAPASEETVPKTMDTMDAMSGQRRRQISFKEAMVNLKESVISRLQAARTGARRSQRMQNFNNIVRLKYNLFINKISRVPNSSKILLTIAIIAALGFGYSIFFVRGNTFEFLSPNSENETLTKVEETLTQAESKIIFGDNEEAKRLIAMVEADLENIKVDSNKDQEFSSQLIARLNAAVAKLRKITLIEDPSQIYVATGTTTPLINSINHIDDFIYIFDKANNQVIRLNTRSREATTLSGNITGTIKTANISSNGKILFLTEDNKFYRLEGTSIQPVSVVLEPDEIVSDFTFYNDYLYNIIASRNQVYRHPNDGNNYLAGLTWIQESGASIAGANSIGIDNSIWLSTESGQILNFFKGYKQAFAIKDLDPALERIDAMIKNEESDYIYLLESKNNRVVVLDTEGNTVTQYFSPSLENVTSFDIDENGKALYLANNNEIYAIIMNHFK